jgi:hypothetical protein
MERNERRNHPRCQTRETATVICDAAYSGRYLVANLSAGGALLVGDVALPLGSTIGLLLEPPGRPGLVVVGRVVRQAPHESGRQAFAIAFDRGDRDGIRALVDYVNSLLQRQMVQMVSEANSTSSPGPFPACGEGVTRLDRSRWAVSVVTRSQLGPTRRRTSPSHSRRLRARTRHATFPGS